MNCVSSKINLNLPQIKKLSKATSTALSKTVMALHTEVVNEQVIPFDSGNMQNNSTFEELSDSSKGKVDLITSTPYARRVYFHPEYNFQKKENVNAQGLWYKSWIYGKNKDFCEKTFAEFYKKETGL